MIGKLLIAARFSRLERWDSAKADLRRTVEQQSRVFEDYKSSKWVRVVLLTEAWAI